jgi:hypothetical protein
MGTEIKTWQIIDNKLISIDTTMPEGDRLERELEQWIESNPEIIGSDVMIIGRQVETDSGPIDLLGVDRSGNAVIIELKRGLLPRNVLAQAIDYASNVAEWKDGPKLNEECQKYTQKLGEEKDLGDAFNEAFEGEVDLESITFNSSQRIILVGFAIETSLERMIEWLSESYNVNINAVILSYAKTNGVEEHELLMKTSIIAEEIEQKRMTGKPGRFDAPGNYGEQDLKQQLFDYLSLPQVTNQRIRKILLPTLLKIQEPNKLSRDQLKSEFVAFDKNYNESKVGYYLTLISTQLGMKKNDFLRQIIAYEYPRHPWEKDNFSIRNPEYRNWVKEVLEKIEGNVSETSQVVKVEKNEGNP